MVRVIETLTGEIKIFLLPSLSLSFEKIVKAKLLELFKYVLRPPLKPEH
jgi:hypothetical protein